MNTSTPSTPTAFQYVATPTRTPYQSNTNTPLNQSASPSGYNTPKRGIAFTPGSNSRGRGSNDNNRGSNRGGGGRGGSNNNFNGKGFVSRGAMRGGIGGLGFNNPIAGDGYNSPFSGGSNSGNSPGFIRTLLVPVKFVKATALPSGLGGDTSDEEEDDDGEEEEEDAIVLGDLEDQVMEGALIEVVRDLALQDIEDDDERDQIMDEVQAQLIVQDVQPSFISSTDPSPVAPSSNSFSLPPNFVLGLTNDADSDSEEEQIVFTPQVAVSPKITVMKPVAILRSPPAVLSIPHQPYLFPTQVDSIPSPLTAILHPPSPISETKFTFVSPIRPVVVPMVVPVIIEEEILAEEEEEIETPVPFVNNSTSFNIEPPTLSEDSDSEDDNEVGNTSKAQYTLAPKLKLPRLTSSQKRAAKAQGKKARKNGTTHARSGNQHLFQVRNNDASDEEDEAMIDEDADGEGAKMLKRMGMDAEDIDLSTEFGLDTTNPREGDSDLDWGDNGPGGKPSYSRGPTAPSGSNRKQRRKLERAERKEVERMERLSIGAREEVAIALGVGSDRVVVKQEKELVVEVKGKKSSKRVKDTRGLDEAAQDYVRNLTEGGESIMDLAFLLRNTLDGGQTTIDELDDEERANAEEDGAGWETTEESESGKDDIDSAAEEDETSDEEMDSDDELERDILLGEADAA